MNGLFVPRSVDGHDCTECERPCDCPGLAGVKCQFCSTCVETADSADLDQLEWIVADWTAPR